MQSHNSERYYNFLNEWYQSNLKIWTAKQASLLLLSTPEEANEDDSGKTETDTVNHIKVQNTNVPENSEIPDPVKDFEQETPLVKKVKREESPVVDLTL
jgi:hypothetical protein